MFAAGQDVISAQDLWTKYSRRSIQDTDPCAGSLQSISVKNLYKRLCTVLFAHLCTTCWYKIPVKIFPKDLSKGFLCKVPVLDLCTSFGGSSLFNLCMKVDLYPVWLGNRCAQHFIGIMLCGTMQIGPVLLSEKAGFHVVHLARHLWNIAGVSFCPLSQILEVLNSGVHCLLKSIESVVCFGDTVRSETCSQPLVRPPTSFPALASGCFEP